MKITPIKDQKATLINHNLICSPKELEIIKMALNLLVKNVTIKPTITIKATDMLLDIFDYSNRTK